MTPEQPESVRSLFENVFKAYDIRGTVPEELNARMAYAIGVGFGTFVLAQALADRRIVLCRDIRKSGVELSRAFSAGVLSTGLGVVDAGLASTDLLYFASGLSWEARFRASSCPSSVYLTFESMSERGVLA